MRNLILLLFTCWSFWATAQYYSYPFKIQIGVGGASYYGDLSEEFSTNTWGYNLALNTRSVLNPHFSAYTHLNLFRLSSQDQVDAVRNLYFRSDNIGFGLGVYYSFTKYKVHSEYQGKVTPYIGVGIGGLFFNPKAQYKNDWYELQGLTTEGQNYSRFTWQAPFHIGLSYRISDWVTIGIEYSYYFTFTDYLDDVSGEYVDNQTLLGVSADLADRTFEGDNIPDNTIDGEHWKATTQRGDNQKIDKYNLISIYIEIDLVRKNVVMFH